MPSPGQKAPSFELLDLEGAPYSLRGPVLLVFFKISCPVCQMTLPFLDRVTTVPVVAISQDDAAATRRFHKRFGASMRTLLDPEESGFPVSNAFGISHVPSLFLIDAGGTISMASEGFVKSDLEAMGVSFRQEESVPAWKAG